MTEIKKLTFPASLCKQVADTWLCSASQTYPCGVFLLESKRYHKDGHVGSILTISGRHQLSIRNGNGRGSHGCISYLVKTRQELTLVP